MQTAAAERAHQTFDRYEVKYLVDTRVVPSLLRECAPYTMSDPHSSDWGYAIHSIYWDTEDFRFFWEKIEGLTLRRKLRFRRYGDSTDVFVEIKQREDRTVQKRRIRLSAAGTLVSYLRGERPDASLQALVGPVESEVGVMIERFNLRPRMAIRYRRRALVGAFDPELRITIDGRIRYHPSDFDLEHPFDGGRDVVDPRISVLEFKYNHRAPTWLTKTLRRHGLETTRMSKYCSAVDRHYFGGDNTWTSSHLETE